MRKLKEKLNAKLSKNGGFTLIEMLIVVAIIAILIAVSIPLVSGALDKAKKATDAANVRAAIAEASIEYLTKDGAEVPATIYDAANGKLDSSTTTTYGKVTANTVVWVKVSSDGQVSWAWGSTGSTEPASSSWQTGQPVEVS